MADFNLAFNKTMSHEGGYSNDPDDAGGETYRGISHRYHPAWEGWEVIESIIRKHASDWLSVLNNFTSPEHELDRLTRSFYKRMYWDINRLDWMPQPVADEMFDTGVNMGVLRAAIFLQRALNYLNRNGRLFTDLVDDGDVGPLTMMALSTLLAAAPSDVWVLLKIMNVLQGMHYLDYMDRSPTQEKFARGWFQRVDIGKV